MDETTDYKVRMQIREALLRRDLRRLQEATGAVADETLARIVVREEMGRTDWSTARFWLDHLSEMVPADEERLSRGFALYKERLGVTPPVNTVRFFGHPIVLVAFALEDDPDQFETKPMCFEHGPTCAVGGYLALHWDLEDLALRWNRENPR